MTTTAAPVSVKSPGVDDRIYDITFIDSDTTTGPIAHGLPFTPSLFILQAKVANAIYADYAVAVTATTFTVTKSIVGATSGSVQRLFLGRFPNPQNDR
jgi:hypothetical protein